MQRNMKKLKDPGILPQLLVASLLIVGVQGYLLLQPNYTSQWTPIKARNSSHAELTFDHGLHEMPVKVVAVVKAKLPDGKLYFFNAVGTAQTNTETQQYFGGIVCLYNETIVKVYTPNNNMGTSVFLGLGAWEGILSVTQQRMAHLLPLEGDVQVKAYSKFDFPMPDFHVSWTPLRLQEAPYVFQHNLQEIPDIVVVQIKGNKSGLVSEAQGSVSIINPKTSPSNSGVIFGYSNQSIRVWTVSPTLTTAGKLFFVGNGWGSSTTSIAETKGLIQIFAWKFRLQPCEQHVDSETIWPSYLPKTIITPACKTLSKHFLSVETEVTTGPNMGYRFPAVGSVMNDGVLPGDTSGLIFAYLDNSVYIWKPRPQSHNNNGYLAAVSQQWGDSSTTQTTNDVEIAVTIWNHFKLSDISCEEDYRDRFNQSSPAAVVHLTSYTYNATIEMLCMKAYRMTGGNNTVNCTRQGLWSGDPIQCKKITCPGAVGNTSITNGWTYIEGVHLNNRSFSGCDQGFSLKELSSAVRNCLETEEWSSVDPVCEVITCPSNVPQVEAASITMLGNKFNDQLTYECQPGYPHIEGDLTRTCQSDGNWSGVTPVCEYCMCNCSNLTMPQQIYEENLQELLKRLTEQLIVKKNETSMAKRAKISVYEDRPTAKGLGALGCFLLATCFLLIIVPDIPKLIHHIRGTS